MRVGGHVNSEIGMAVDVRVGRPDHPACGRPTDGFWPDYAVISPSGSHWSSFGTVN